MNKDDLDKNLDGVNDWIRSADQKVGILFALEGLVLTLSFSNLVAWMSSTAQDGRCYSLVGGISGIVILLFSIYKAATAIIPRLKHKGAKSPLFFGDVSSMELSTFRDEIENMSEKKYKDQLIRQVHITSNIATSKHQHLRDSMLAFLCAMIVLMASCAIQYYGY